MIKADRPGNQHSPQPEQKALKPWVKPVIVKMSAGSAENGFSATRNDGQFSFS